LASWFTRWWDRPSTSAMTRWDSPAAENHRMICNRTASRRAVAASAAVEVGQSGDQVADLDIQIAETDHVGGGGHPRDIGYPQIILVGGRGWRDRGE
jgi:hypothetical protein